jgi:hypothetical protein
VSEVAYRLNPGVIYKPVKPERDAAYLRFVRSHQCVVCSCWQGIEAAHTGPKGLGQKSADRSVVPLCRKHHQAGTVSLHKLGPVKFEQRHGLNIAEIRGELNREYDELLAKRKPIR